MLFYAIVQEERPMPQHLAIGPLPHPVPAAFAIAALLSLASGDARPATAVEPPIEIAMLASAAGPAIALSGDLAAVQSGSGVEVFKRQGDSWSRQALIAPPADM
jgi:hypothetical protein